MSHDRLSRLHSADNRLLVGGRPIIAWLDDKQRAHYLYSRSEITQRVQQLRTVMPADLQLHYAIKANPMPALLATMATLVDGLDVASAGELELALAGGISPARISFAGPAKQQPELLAAMRAGVTLNVESATELQRIIAIGKSQQLSARIALRLNPDFELKQSGLQMAGGARPFGIDTEQLPELLALLPGTDIQLLGLHIFAGSQNLDANAIQAAHSQTFALAYEVITQLAAANLADQLQYVNIGGGLGIPYFAGQVALDLAPVAANLKRLMAARQGRLARLAIVMELGRYLVGEAGYYVCRISDIKQSRGKTYYLTNGGLHHHLSNSGNFGQVIRKNYPVVLADNLNSADCQSVDIVGPLCTPLDIVAANLALPKAAIGDYVVVLQSGAYGFSASPLGFLGHPPPVEKLVD